MNIPKTLAIDYGTVRVGLATSHATLAEPLKIVSNNTRLFEEIQETCIAEDIEQVLVGISENEMAVKTHEFIEELRRHIDLPILTADETLSSQAVHKKLQTAKKSKRSGDIDHYAAAEFLQYWLDEVISGEKK